ncbi:hypothetical protein GJAV_G00015170 [Gymnothorax javanicus]|nr:hypothetical protein GJAV_G00015170 [Gymnothorax javanicus]
MSDSFSSSLDTNSPAERWVAAARELVLRMYGEQAGKCKTLNELCYKLATTTDKPATQLPPTKDAFKQHASQSRYPSLIWCHSHVPKPQLDDPEEYGWYRDSCGLHPVLFTQDSAPAELNVDIYEDDPVLENIRQEGHYNYMDIVTVHRDTMPNYNEKLKAFYKEHLHLDDEIRYVLDGAAYFDVRDQDDKWIRIFVSKGTMILLPAGIYHRFTPDKANYTKAMRLFSGEPQWKAYFRPAGHFEVRKKYLQSLKSI